MNYKEIINNPEYKEIASIEHDNIKEFLMQEIPDNQGWARIANMYQLVGIFAVIIGLFKVFMPFYAHRISTYLVAFGLGLLFTFTVLIVLHEIIHALAYKYVGAKKLSFGINISKFLFYVQADEQVFNYKQFKIVALAPAVLIAVLSLLGMVIFYNEFMFFFLIPVFGMHSLFCSGDFGMLCFFQNCPDMDIVTFDIKPEGKTYFYGKENI